MITIGDHIHTVAGDGETVGIHHGIQADGVIIQAGIILITVAGMTHGIIMEDTMEVITEDIMVVTTVVIMVIIMVDIMVVIMVGTILITGMEVIHTQILGIETIANRHVVMNITQEMPEYQVVQPEFQVEIQ